MAFAVLSKVVQVTSRTNGQWKKIDQLLTQLQRFSIQFKKDGKRKLAGALFMESKAAFNYVSTGQLLTRMTELGIDDDLFTLEEPKNTVGY